MSEETKEKLITKIELRYAVHMLIMFAFAVGIAWFSNEVILENAWNGRYILLAGVLCAVIALCAFLERKKLYETVRRLGILIACFIVSGLLLLLSDFYINLPVWLLGGIVAAALVNRNVGMLYLYYFVFHAIYLQGSWLNGLVFHLVVASLISFFMPKMKTFLSMLYMMAFAACIIVTGSIIHNQMAIDESMLLDTFYILCTYLGCVFITMLLVKWNNDKGITEEEQVSDNYAYLELLAEDTAKKDAEAEKAAEMANGDPLAVAEEAAETTEETIEEAVTEEVAKPEEVVENTVTENVADGETVQEELSAEKPVAEETVKEQADAEAVEVAEETVTVEDAKNAEEVQTVKEAVVQAEENDTQSAVADENTSEEAAAEETITEEPVVEEATEEPVIEETVEKEPIDYTPYCDEKAELLQELRAKDKAAYARAVLVGKLASATAERMGLDRDLTKAAGLYKFIGKIRENNDEYTATAIAKEHNFPEALIYLLDQLNHNIVEQKEAAVILITYGVISNYSIVRGAQKDVPVEKIVDTVVSKKIFQGEFNESGLNVQECFMLRETLITLLKDQDKKHAAKQPERKKA